MMYSLTGKKWGAGGSYGCVPKPVLAKLGNPKRTIYTIQDDLVLISNTDS